MFKINKILFFSLFFFGSVSISLFSEEFSGVLQRFTHKAFVSKLKKDDLIEEGKDFLLAANEYGNKTANLCVLAGITQDVKGVGVPDFFAISHNDIKAFLDDSFSMLLFGRVVSFDVAWKLFQRAQSDKSTTLDSEVIEILKIMQEGIKKAFKSVLTQGRIPAKIKKELEKYLARKTFRNKQLMVRSTGKEDSKYLANAGGNKSFVVDGIIEAVWLGMGEVVASYLSEKSLFQRLMSIKRLEEKELRKPVKDRDGKLLREMKKYSIKSSPFMPVLIQVMIGEESDKVPVSGVMFTQEAEGRTEGVTHIQSAYGHGEGVVNSIVAVDTYYVGRSGVIHPVIREKAERMVPTVVGNQVKLANVANDKTLRYRSSLGKKQIDTFKQLAGLFEDGKNYGVSMDVEFVVRDDFIYLVQARPIVLLEKEKEPDYLIPDYIKAKETVAGSSLGLAGGFVRIVESRDEVLVADDLPQALSLYQKDKANSRIKITVVAKTAPSTSHEATMFRGFDVPVLVVDDAGRRTLEEWLNDETVALFFDTQKAFAVKGQKGDFAAKEKIINEGWITHPLPKELSIDVAFLPSFDWTRKVLDKEKFWGKVVRKKGVGIFSLLEDLKIASSKKEGVAILQQILHRFFSFLKVEEGKISLKHFEAQDGIEEGGGDRAALLALCTLGSAAEILEHWGESGSLGRLYAIRFLEALVSQKGNGILNAFSYGLFLHEQRADLAVVSKISKRFSQEAKPIAVSLMKVGSFIMNDDVREKWEAFVNGVAGMENESGALKRLIIVVENLDRLGALAMWLNIIFPESWQESRKDSEKCVKSLLEEYRASAAVRKNVTEYRRILEVWQAKKGLWADPKAFDGLLASFKKDFVSTFITGNTSKSKQAYEDMMYVETERGREVKDSSFEEEKQALTDLSF